MTFSDYEISSILLSKILQLEHKGHTVCIFYKKDEGIVFSIGDFEYYSGAQMLLESELIEAYAALRSFMAVDKATNA